MSYRYEPLPDTQHIRLLSLHALSGHNSVAATLSTHSLDDPVAYGALSYAWGVAETRCAIQIDGSSFQVWPNSYAALLRLVQAGRIGPVWIDAICIIQNDKAEKAMQVPLMSDIYTHASSVYVWLDEASTAEEQASIMLPDMLDRLEKADLLARPTFQEVPNLSQTFQELGLPPLSRISESA